MTAVSRWRIWKDDYIGEEWNDRREVFDPSFAGHKEYSEDEIIGYLSSLFNPNLQEQLEVDVFSEDKVSIQLSICAICDDVWPCKTLSHTTPEVEDGDLSVTYISYHAERQ